MVFTNSRHVEDLVQPKHDVEHCGAPHYQTIAEIQYCVRLWPSLQATGLVVEGVSGWSLANLWFFYRTLETVMETTYFIMIDFNLDMPFFPPFVCNSHLQNVPQMRHQKANKVCTNFYMLNFVITCGTINVIVYFVLKKKV